MKTASIQQGLSQRGAIVIQRHAPAGWKRSHLPELDIWTDQGKMTDEQYIDMLNAGLHPRTLWVKLFGMAQSGETVLLSNDEHHRRLLAAWFYDTLKNRVVDMTAQPPIGQGSAMHIKIEDKIKMLKLDRERVKQWIIKATRLALNGPVAHFPDLTVAQALKVLKKLPEFAAQAGQGNAVQSNYATAHQYMQQAKNNLTSSQGGL